MWHHKYLLRIDYKIIITIFLLMAISVLVISSMTEDVDEGFLTNVSKSQIKWFLIGWGVFFLLSGFDYRRLKDLSVILYVLMVVLLLGVYFATPIQSVHRWYKIPFIGMNVQPSELAKLIVVIFLGWFLEKKGSSVSFFSSSIQVMILAGIPFFLILKQPDLGTALIFYPIVLGMSYFAGVNKKVIKTFFAIALAGMVLCGLMFTNVLSHEKIKPYATKVLKEYQYARLNPNTYHQKAAKIAIAIGGISGMGWKKGEFSSKKWLPAAHTDSVFAAFGEEFGLIGMLIMLFLFYSLIHFSFQVACIAKDNFGRLLASGIAVYLAMHIIVNIAMMCGFLPISGVPLLLVTYGGSSVIMTMAGLGILQSIYTRRFMF